MHVEPPQAFLRTTSKANARARGNYEYPGPQTEYVGLERTVSNPNGEAVAESA